MDHIDLTDFFQTKSGSFDFSERVARISEEVFTSGFTIDTVLMREFGLEKKEKILQILRDNGIDIAQTTTLKDFFAKLIEQVKHLPVLSMKIAFEPNEQTLKSLSEWFVMNLKKQILLDISVDVQVMGGANISYNGAFLDISIRKQFEQIIDDVLVNNNLLAPSEIPQEIKTVKHDLEHFSLGR